MFRICIPESKTKSFASSPTLPKRVKRVETLWNGAGRPSKTSAVLDMVPSLLPVGTFQKGPPYKSMP